MAATVEHSLSSNWTEIAAGAVTVIIQNRSLNNVLVFAGASASPPAPGSAAGVTLWSEERSIVIGPMAAGDKCWCRSAGGSAAITAITV